MYRDYHEQNVQFFYVYKSLAHPGINSYMKAFSIEERLKHIAEFKKITGSRIPWICDTMDNEFQMAFSNAPNGEFVIDPEGKVVRKRYWSNPRTLRADLAELVGPVETPTAIKDLEVSFQRPDREVASGVVPRIELPGGLRALQISPQKSEFPFFAKLRAEANADLIRNEAPGQLYLALYLDPLYRVHWNNRAGQLRVEIKGAEAVSFAETELTGPEVEEDADIDPRQFLINVNRNGNPDPLEVVVSYIVCDDEETFCHTIQQTYTVQFQMDRTGGSRPGTFMPGMFAKVRELDVNRDGRITRDELPEGGVTLHLSHMDRNDDDVIDTSEIESFMSMFFDGRGLEDLWDDGKNPDETTDETGKDPENELKEDEKVTDKEKLDSKDKEEKGSGDRSSDKASSGKRG